eukprot:TRINITY_DN3652_c1_g1_i1.p1 TRINITY_DN3652_c1_g1~~TRINITY_DN3652_c1_g1_i1.p1  ORF type:complete len:292 (+),score=19.10 TRINITY_DN3652_c1_g1_i1:40-915(+)
MSTRPEYNKETEIVSDVQPAWVSESHIGIGLEPEVLSPVASSSPRNDTGDDGVVKESDKVAIHTYITTDSALSLCTQTAGWVTDYLLCGVGLGLAISLISEGIPEPVAHETDTLQIWVLLFLLTSSLSGLMGGLIHHHCHRLLLLSEYKTTIDARLKKLWSAVLIVGSLPNFCLFSMGTWLVVKKTSTALVVTYFGAGFYGVVALAVGYTRRIKIHIFASLPTILYLTGSSIYRLDEDSAKWVLAASIGLVGAGCVVAFKISPSPDKFNHNALLHCCLIVCCTLMYVGIRI